jgi:hypothetical protein
MADETVEGQEETSPAPRRRAKRSPNGVNRSTLCVQLTSEERALLEAKAANAGQSMSRVLVTGALHASTAESINGADLDRLVRELTIYGRQLRGVTTNLNQLTQHANATQEFPRDVRPVLNQVVATMSEIHELIGSFER